MVAVLGGCLPRTEPPMRLSLYRTLLGSGGDRLNLDYDEILKERGFQVTGPSAKDRAQRGEAGGVGAERRELEVAALYNGPFPRLRSLLCLAQRSFPLLAGVVLRAPLPEHGIRDLEVAMRFAIEPRRVPGTIKLLHCGGLADWAKERPGQRSATFSNPSPCSEGI